MSINFNDLFCQSIFLYLISKLKDSIPKTEKKKKPPKTCQDKDLDIEIAARTHMLSLFNVKENSAGRIGHPQNPMRADSNCGPTQERKP